MDEPMDAHLTVARSELILGGQKSGKSRRAERLAGAWALASPAHRAVLIATAEARDEEMRARIARHRRDRAVHAPGLATVEAPQDLAAAVAAAGGAETLRVVDCLTLWLTQRLMPAMQTGPAPKAQDEQMQDRRIQTTEQTAAQTAALLEAIDRCPGPIVLIGNEIGLGVIPLGRELRAFVDALGALNQAVAARCERVTFMAAGLPLTLKDAGR